jgi:hypothetical protein
MPQVQDLTGSGAMNRLMNQYRRSMPAMGLVLLSSTGLLSAAVWADPANQAASIKRQTIRGCMTRQMAADRTLSYNAAAKVCSDRVKASLDAQVASSTGPGSRGK